MKSHPDPNRRWILVAASSLLALAQAMDASAEVRSLSSLASSQHSFVLTPGDKTASLPIVVDATGSFSFNLLAASQTLDVSIVAPGGARYTVGDADTAAFQSGFFPIDAAATRPGASYQGTLVNPQVGTWTLEVSEPEILLEAINGVVTVLLNNRTILVLAGGGATYPADTDIRVAAVVFDAAGKLPGAVFDAEIFRPGDPSFAARPVLFRDDGTEADTAAGDGIFQAFVNLAEAGDYQIQVDATGVASTGTFERTAATLIKVVVQTAEVLSFTDRGIDSDGDQLFNRIGVTPSATITKAASYVIGVRLTASNGKSIYKTVDAVFGTGTGQAEVTFEAEDILRELGVDGPYQVTEVRLFEMLAGGDLLLTGVGDGLGPTAAYEIAQLQHPPLSLTGTGDSNGEDQDENRLFDSLVVTLGVFADFAGNYQYSVSLYSVDGTELGFLNGSAYFDVGANSLELSFPGRPIGVASANGPYFVANLLVFNSNHSLVSPHAFTTASFKAWQFEGYKPKVNLAKLRAQSLLKKRIRSVKSQIGKAKGNKKKLRQLKKQLRSLERRLRMMR